MKIRCNNCKHKWDYKGKSKYYATCPNCYRKVNLKKCYRKVNLKKYSIQVKGGEK